MPITKIGCRWRNGFQEFYSLDGSDVEVVDVMAPIKMFHDFNGPAVDNTNDFNVAAVNGGTATSVDGFMILLTGAADDDNVEVATDLVFQAQYGCVLEARLRSDDVLQQSYFVGFTDAITEGADLLPIDYSTGGALLTTASDAAGFFQCSDNGADIMCGSVIANTDSTPQDTGTDAVIAALHTYRVEIDTAGNAKYFFDGVYVGTDTLAVTTTDPLCAYVGNITRHGSANTVDVDYIRAWGGRQ